MSDEARVPLAKFVVVKTQTLVPLVENNFVGLLIGSYAANAAAPESSIEHILTNRWIEE